MKKRVPIKYPKKVKAPHRMPTPFYLVLMIIVCVLAAGLLLAFAANQAGRLFLVTPPIKSTYVIKPIEFKQASRVVAPNIYEEEYLTLAAGHTGLDPQSFLIAPNGESFAYLVRQSDNSVAVALNGRSGPSYEAITFMRFSADSQHFAYGAKVRGQELVILDGREGKLYDWTFEPRLFSPDGQFVYKARVEGGDVMVINEWESRPYDRIYGVTVTADQKQLVYFARQGETIWRTTVKLNDSEGLNEIQAEAIEL